jgi:hypothetical protein
MVKWANRLTANRDIDRDREKALELLDRINQAADIGVSQMSWLEHTGGNGQIDFELLWGTTLASMKTPSGPFMRLPGAKVDLTLAHPVVDNHCFSHDAVHPQILRS